MARSYKYDEDDAPEPQERRQQDRQKRDARKAAQFYTPAPVTRALLTRTTRNE